MAQVHQAAQGSTDAEWDDVLARVAADEDFKFFAQQRAEAKRNKPMTPAQQKEYMSNYIKNQEGGYSIKQLKSLSFEQVKEIFETTMRKIREALGSGEESAEKEKELSKEELQKLLVIVPVEEVYVEALQIFAEMLKKFDKDDLVKLWDLVKERFSTTEPTDDKEKELYVQKGSTKPVWNNAQRVNHQNFAKKTHPYAKKNMVLRAGNPQMDLHDQGVIHSGCSRNMTGSMPYLTNYEEIDGGCVTFGGNPKGGKIIGKAKKSVRLMMEKLFGMKLELVLFWSTVKAKTINGEVQLHALVDGKKIIAIESTVRRDLQLEDAEGIDCLPNSTIFEELTRMGYEKISQNLTFYKAFFSPQWKFWIHTILQCLSSKTTTWNEFSSTMASVIICLAINQKFKFSKYIFESMVRNLDNLSEKFLMYPRVHIRSDEDRLKLDELMELCTNLQTRVLDLEKTKTTQHIEIDSLKRRFKKLEKKRSLRTHKLKRLYKVGLSARVESSRDEQELGEDASKNQG
ncbi:hypothetical protein Tco_1005916 [Tanacetum coccineum]|uniref:Uncharacterized protein n=1 Tax=Tanacetum coccineum TaxID=301880 RepID=A0ABQ5FGK5_9ASTR